MQDLPTVGKFHGLPLCNVGDAALYSALILAARITFAHLAVSDLMTTANSSGELRDTSRPSCAIRSRTSACSAICTMSACTLLTTAAGVPTGPNSPNQEMASKSGKPDSASVGSSEMIGERLSDVTARPRSFLVVDSKDARHHQNASNRREIARWIEGGTRLKRRVDSHCAV